MLCFGTFPVANRFMDKKGGFLSHNTEIFRKGTLLCCFRKFLVANKFMYKKGAINIFRRKFIVAVPKLFTGEPSKVSLVSAIEKFYASEGFVTFFRRKLLSHSTETIRRGTLLCSVSEKFW